METKHAAGPCRKSALAGSQSVCWGRPRYLWTWKLYSSSQSPETSPHRRWLEGAIRVAAAARPACCLLLDERRCCWHEAINIHWWQPDSPAPSRCWQETRQSSSTKGQLHSHSKKENCDCVKRDTKLTAVSIKITECCYNTEWAFNVIVIANNGKKWKVYCCTWCCINRVQRTVSGREVQLFWQRYHMLADLSRYSADLCYAPLRSFVVLCGI